MKPRVGALLVSRSRDDIPYVITHVRQDKDIGSILQLTQMDAAEWAQTKHRYVRRPDPNGDTMPIRYNALPPAVQKTLHDAWLGPACEAFAARREELIDGFLAEPEIAEKLEAYVEGIWQDEWQHNEEHWQEWLKAQDVTLD